MQEHSVRLLKLELRNFMSYGNNITTFNLDFAKTVLILGRNLDSTVDGQVDSNGAGKTTILQAISYVCYDDTLAAIKSEKPKVDKLINFVNGKNMKVSLEFYNKRYYRIERFRKLKDHGTGVYFLVKDDPNEPWNYAPAAEGGHDITKDSTGNVNDTIAEKIGLPFEVFSRLVIISADSAAFLSLKLDEQRNIVEELFGFTELTEKAERLKIQIANNKKDLETLQQIDLQIQQEQTRYDSQLRAAQLNLSNWHQEHAFKVATAEGKIIVFNREYGMTNFDVEAAKYPAITALEAEIKKAENEYILMIRDYDVVIKKIGEVHSWEENHRNIIARLEAAINAPAMFKSIEEIQNLERELLKIQDESKGLADQISSCRTAKMTEENAIKLIEKDVQSTRVNVDRKSAEIQKLSNDLDHLNDSKCPYCSQQYTTTPGKISEISNRLEILKTESTEMISSITTLLERKESHTTSLKMQEEDLVRKLRLHEDCVARKNALLMEKIGTDRINFQTEYQKISGREKLRTELEVARKATNPHCAEMSLGELEALSNELSDSYINFANNTITVLKSKKQSLEKELIFPTLEGLNKLRYDRQTWDVELTRLALEENPYQKTVDAIMASPPSERKTAQIQKLHDTVLHQDFLHKLLTKKDSFIRKALINRYIPFLNTRIKYYLDRLGLPHKVEFQQDMSVKITQFKSELEYGGASKGQKARINLSLAFAFRDVLQSRYGAFNFCILDECLDTGLGNVGVQLAAKMIKDIAREHQLSMLVISHRDEIANMFNSKLVVELKRGFTTVIESDI
jgi:hypothetical protein